MTSRRSCLRAGRPPGARPYTLLDFFPEGFLNEVQIIGQLMSADLVNDSDIAMVNGASAALAISDIPWGGPIAAVRVGLIDGNFVANPNIEQMYSSSLDLIYVGSENDLVMIEGEAQEISEADMMTAIEFAHAEVKKIVAGIRELPPADRASFPDEAGGAARHAERERLVIALHVFVAVPVRADFLGGGVFSAAVDLNEAHPSFDESSGDEALATKGRGPEG